MILRAPIKTFLDVRTAKMLGKHLYNIPAKNGNLPCNRIHKKKHQQKQTKIQGTWEIAET